MLHSTVIAVILCASLFMVDAGNLDGISEICLRKGFISTFVSCYFNSYELWKEHLNDLDGAYCCTQYEINACMQADPKVSRNYYAI